MGVPKCELLFSELFCETVECRAPIIFKLGFTVWSAYHEMLVNGNCR